MLKVDDIQTATLLKSALVLSYRSDDFFPKLTAVNLLSGILLYCNCSSTLLDAYDKAGDHINQSYNLTYKVSMERELRQSVDEARRSPYTISLLTTYLDSSGMTVSPPSISESPQKMSAACSDCHETTPTAAEKMNAEDSYDEVVISLMEVEETPTQKPEITKSEEPKLVILTKTALPKSYVLFWIYLRVQI